MTGRPTIMASIWLYRQLLIFYPVDFRRAYGREVTQVFATQCRQTTNRQGLLHLWLVTLVDLLTNALEEVLMIANRKRQLILVTGLLFGLAAGIVGSVNAVTSATLVGDIGEEVISYIALLTIAALAFGSGVVAARASKRAITGLWVGLLVGGIASLIATSARVGYSISFYDTVRNDPGEIRDWIHRGGGSFVSYLIADRIGGYIYTTLFVGCICGVCGIGGGLISKAREMRQVS
ncbi:MAG: hypothetical protein H0X37_05385 [Herpetosiphonaceae bacterium]|nr:hypothetical protein [Herpetosiphonaceae bacterium]